MSPPDTYYDALSRLHLLPAKAARPEPLHPRRLVYNRPIIEKGPPSRRVRLVGLTLAHYQIKAAIGAGGMGQVYRATDTKLGREVALKVLPQAVANDPERLARFQREARAVAALNHPNVVTLYSVEESDGIHFLTMELLEGQSLDHLIPARGLSAEQNVEIGNAIAEALAAAHEKGIIHRDLKPANVMLTTDGRVKVLDFGLAKNLGAETASEATLTAAGQTQAGMVMGTPAYMSPEQVSGRTLDHRTDIFSLGVLLHEMATGHRPFEGTSSAELISAILRDNPPPVTDLRADLPSDLARVIRRCLEKDPRHRLQTARDVANEFRDMARSVPRSTPTPTSPSRATKVPDSGAARADEGFWIAVLSFRHKGTNPSLESLSDGLTDEIITGLSRFSYLRVIARGSTAKYSSESGDVRRIGGELGARYVMEGSLRQAGSKLRVAVQLVDATTGAHLWAENYERAFDAEAIFELQDDLVPRIVSTVADMNGALPRSMSQAVRGRDPAQLTPYEAVLRAFGYFEHLDPAELSASRSALEAAVNKSPSSSDAWALLALLNVHDYAQGFEMREDALPAAASAAQRAVESGPSNHLAYYALAQTSFFLKEYQAFRAAAERCLALNASDGNCVASLGGMMVGAGSNARGIELAGRAKQLNPNHPGWYWYSNFHHAYSQGDYQGAVEAVGKANLPRHWSTPWMLAAAYGQLGQTEEAAKCLRRAFELRPKFASSVRRDIAKWYHPALAEHVLAGLRKAGMQIPDPTESAPVISPTTPVATTKRDSGAARTTDEAFWVAVLPFKYVGNNSDLAALAQGLTDDIITGMSRFPYLRIIAGSSTARYANQTVEVRSVGRELGARYVLEGNLRQSGSKLRIAVQLVDASSGAHLWAETYERVFHPDSLFEVQDDLVPRIVSTIADTHGVLPHSLSEMLRGKPLEELTPYEAVLRSFAYRERMTPEEHASACAAMERAVRIAPGYGLAWAMLSILLSDGAGQGFGATQETLDRALLAARKAVDLDPSNHRSYQALAAAHYHRKEILPFRAAAERAIALNPMDGCLVANMGGLLASAGEWERGCALVEKALQLNPNHPGWFWFPLFHNAYRKREYREALNHALKINMPGYYFTHLALAAAYGQLGELQAARKAAHELLALAPDFPQNARSALSVWLDPDLAEHYIEGLRKAGLDIPAAHSATGSASTTASQLTRTLSQKPASGATRANEGFWVAVLPFKYTGSNADVAGLAEGLTDEIITGMSRFSYLRVIAGSSTARYAQQAVDVRTAAAELGARYVMEGSLRQAGSKLRVAVQLIDAVSGAHLWAETYERVFHPDSFFEVQDNLVPRIVATVADQFGVLPRSMSEVLRSKSEEELTPHEAVLRAFSYFAHITPDGHAVVRNILERSVREAPDHADSWALLSMIYRGEYAQGFNARPNPLDRALAAARRAVDLAPTHALGHYALATVHFFRKEYVSLRVEAEKALTLNPLDASARAYLGLLTANAGEWERGIQMVESAVQLNPNCPGYFYFADCWNAYLTGKYEKVLEHVARINMPNYFHVPAIRAAALGQLGRYEDARQAVQDLLALRPDFAEVARREYAKWFDSAKIESMVDGLRKAGLNIPDEQVDYTASKNPAAAKTESGVSRANEGLWVAVLPFKYGGSNADLKTLAEGLSEEVVTGLSRFSYLRVIARASTAKYSSESGDVRAIGKELGARYVIEGSLRQAGNKLRVAVQLVDTETTAHLWAETYERAFEPESVFEIQDDVVPRIVSTVADMNGVLTRSMSSMVRSRAPEELTPHEAVLRAFGYFERVTPAELDQAIAGLESATRKAPANADAWAMLALLWGQGYAQGFRADPDLLDKGVAAAQKAVEAAPANHLGWYGLAQARFFQKDFVGLRNAAERAIELNPMDGTSLAGMAEMLGYAGDWERGLALAERARQLNPHHPGWYWHINFNRAYGQRDYQKALDYARRMSQRSTWGAHALSAAAYGQLGDREGAAKAISELLKLRPDAITKLQTDVEKWFNPEYGAHLLEGLRKAGLDIPKDQGAAAAPSHPE